MCMRAGVRAQILETHHSQRLGVTPMAAQTSGDGESSSSMDARLWGKLQSYIDVRIIYAKLPMA